MEKACVGMWLLALGGSALVLTMPAGPAQDGAWTIVTLQMMAVCVLMLGEGIRQVVTWYRDKREFVRHMTTMDLD
jgi:predicted alpha/beta hydrolase